MSIHQKLNDKYFDQRFKFMNLLNIFKRYASEALIVAGLIPMIYNLLDFSKLHGCPKLTSVFSDSTSLKYCFAYIEYSDESRLLITVGVVLVALGLLVMRWQTRHIQRTRV